MGSLRERSPPRATAPPAEKKEETMLEEEKEKERERRSVSLGLLNVASFVTHNITVEGRPRD